MLTFMLYVYSLYFELYTSFGSRATVRIDAQCQTAIETAVESYFEPGNLNIYGGLKKLIQYYT